MESHGIYCTIVCSETSKVISNYVYDKEIGSYRTLQGIDSVGKTFAEGQTDALKVLCYLIPINTRRMPSVNAILGSPLNN